MMVIHPIKSCFIEGSNRHSNYAKFDKFNSNPHFNVRRFSIDGESGLNAFHQAAYDKYCKFIEQVIDGSMTIEEFIDNEFSECSVLPRTDML